MDVVSVGNGREAEVQARAAATLDYESEGEINSFRHWREQVAHPEFSTFVAHLRAAGHGARVVIRSISPVSESDRWDGLESVELKVKLRGLGHHSPSGHILISVARRNAAVWRADISPSANQEGSYGSLNNSTTMDKGMLKEQLEALVLTLLHRLRGEFR